MDPSPPREIGRTWIRTDEKQRAIGASRWAFPDVAASLHPSSIVMNPFRRILVPHDFSEHATQALRVAAGLAREHGGRLLVLHVITPFHPVTALPQEGAGWLPYTDLVPADLVAAELRHLERLVARTVTGGGAPRVACRVEIGDPFHRITDAARSVDSIVMATAGRTGLAHLVIGSVAEKVVRHSPVPVFTIPSRARRATARRRRRTRGRAGTLRAARRR
jgi:nucleotide-binding universal stress UspA family protein